MDKLRFAKAMMMCATATDYVLSDEKISVYWNFLKDFPDDDIETAFLHSARTLKWFPKVSEVIELMTPKVETPEQEAIREWDRVVLALRNSGNAKSSNLLTERVVFDLGGWVPLGRKSFDNLVWVQKEFVRRYVAGVETNISPINQLGSGRIDSILNGIPLL